MSRRVILDTGPLGKIAHPRPNTEIADWLIGLLNDDIEVVIPEIADYELRRSFVLCKLKGQDHSIERLDALRSVLTFLPIDSAIMERAADFWAEARRRGKPTAGPEALDGDAILAAQAERVSAMIATENVGHLEQFGDARNWQEILVAELKGHMS